MRVSIHESVGDSDGPNENNYWGIVHSTFQTNAGEVILKWAAGIRKLSLLLGGIWGPD